MTPDELKGLLIELDIESSVVAFNAGLDRARVRNFVAGDTNALTVHERNLLREKLIVPEDQRVANVAEQGAVLDGAGEFFRKHSVFFLYEKSGGRSTASGTLVEIGDRVFVATARHTIPQGTQMLEFIGANIVYVEAGEEDADGRRDWKGTSRIEVVNGKRHESLDVGFIELRPSALDVLKHEAISLSSVSLRTPQYGRTAFVFGFPFELERERALSGSQCVLHATSLTYSNPVLAPEEWPNVPDDDRVPHETADCFLRYCREDEFKKLVPLGRDRRRAFEELPDKLPAVHGMSGGGFWQRWTPIDQGRIWSASDYELFAIQSSWHEPGRYIRGVQVRHWLELIAELYPELKPIIEEHVTAQAGSACASGVPHVD